MKVSPVALVLSSLLCFAFVDQPTNAYVGEKAIQEVKNPPALVKIENAFSPDDGAEDLVIRVIDSAKVSLRLAAYSFTSPKVVQALLDAKRRGVDVRVVVDEKGNRSKASLSALNILVGAAIPTRTNSQYSIHHDKYIVADETNTQTGSFNYSQAAAKSNSENVIVIWGNKTTAKSYLMHWQDRFGQGREFRSHY